MKYGLRDSLRKLTRLSTDTEKLREGEFWAVRDVSFDLHRGESFGIMGINGAGKTTLLRILNGVYPPDMGEVELRGRIGALIAAGAGFAPMLTGRENVDVNGALLGMTPAEIDGRMEEIIDFSELGQFIDMPVKNYSSGMFVRLGFAVAAMSEPDILLIDEVLAVGDLNFQKKCYDYLHRLKRKGTSIILVSHSIGAVWAICDRGIFMHKGVVEQSGPVEDIIRAYDDQNSRSALAAASHAIVEGSVGSVSDESDKPYPGGEIPTAYGHTKGGTGDVICTSVQIMACDTLEPRTELEFREPFLIEADIEIINPIETPLFRFTIDAVHYKFIATLDSFEQDMQMSSIQPGRYRLHVKVPSQNFRPGTYTINLAVCRKGAGVHLFYWFGAGVVIIRHPSDRFLYSDSNAVLHLDSNFSLEKTGTKADQAEEMILE
jgi:lipopolysaccharide transport system ATP-binding protein